MDEQKLIADFKLKILKRANEFASTNIDYADTREIKDWVDIIEKLNKLDITETENKVHILLEKIGVDFKDDL